MICACSKCHQLYEGLESETARICPRCASIAELLAAAAALNEKVRREISRGGFAKLWTLGPLVKRAELAVEKARSM